jgi:hypothetical protein
MKFYKFKSLIKIRKLYLTAIHCDFYAITFYKNGMYHNPKNAAYIAFDGYKQFILNDKPYGDQANFTKFSWRRFVKLQAFL